jgi:1-acyl-sn-glycerol-3-phosphate acyltransferase
MTLLPFNAALFEVATPAEACVIPMRLRYLDTAGNPSTAPAYDGDISFAKCLRAIIKFPAIIADLKVLPAIPPGLERRAYAQLTRQQIAAELGLD